MSCGSNGGIVDDEIDGCQAMGIQLSGDATLVAGNRFRRNGSGGVYLRAPTGGVATDGLIDGNTFVGNEWLNAAGSTYGQVNLENTQRCVVQGNVFTRATSTRTTTGIVIWETSSH